MRLAEFSEKDFTSTQQVVFPAAFQIDVASESKSNTNPSMDVAGIPVEPSQNDSAFISNSGKTESWLRLHEIQDEIAKRIAYRLHDESAQMLAVIYLELANISRNAPAGTVKNISGIVQKLDGVCEQLRRMSHELCPVILDQFGLMAGLKFLSEGIMKRSCLKVSVVGDPELKINKPRQIVIYKVVQEALSNVIKHAGAKFAHVRVWEKSGKIHCTVTDNGIGILLENSALAVPMGLGLTGINERVAAMHGTCKISSHRGKGTQLHVELQL